MVAYANGHVGLTFSACSSCFHLSNEEQWPISEALKHTLGSLSQHCLGYLLVLCVSAPPQHTIFSSPLCSPLLSLFTLLLPADARRVWAASLWDRLNLTKVIFRRETTAFLLLFSSWDSSDILRWKSVSYWGWRRVGGALESLLNLCKNSAARALNMNKLAALIEPSAAYTPLSPPDARCSKSPLP